MDAKYPWIHNFNSFKIIFKNFSKLLISIIIGRLFLWEGVSCEIILTLGDNKDVVTQILLINYKKLVSYDYDDTFTIKRKII